MNATLNDCYKNGAFNDCLDPPPLPAKRLEPMSGSSRNSATKHSSQKIFCLDLVSTELIAVNVILEILAHTAEQRAMQVLVMKRTAGNMFSHTAILSLENVPQKQCLGQTS